LLLTMILAVLTAVLLLVFVLRLARQPGGKVNLGDPEFDLGRAAVFAPKVGATGPLIFAPLRPGSVTLYVQHVAADPTKGWLAFGALPPGETSQKCFVQWRPPTHDFIDPCTHTVYPGDGTGLDQYAVRVDSSGHVIINLRRSIGTTPTSSAS
jgi:hypothetical protein